MKKAKTCLEIISILVLLLACRPHPEPSPTPTALPPQAVPTWTPTATFQPPNTPTPEPPSTPTTQPSTPTTPPPVSGDGPLPAVWTQFDFGLPAGDLYRPYSMAVDETHGLLYALGMCDASSYYTAPIETCISVLDLESEQVQRRITVDASSYGTLKLIDETLYIIHRWSGDLVGLDAETLTVTKTMSDVVDLADDGMGALYALTVEGVQRLKPDFLYRPLESTFSNQPTTLLATPEYILALGYESLRILDTRLNLRHEIDLREQLPRAMVLDETGNRLYIGGNKGLVAIEVESGQIVPLNTNLTGIEHVLFDRERDELILIIRFLDWYGGQQVVVVDAQTGTFRRTLYETRESSLFALAFDPLQPRLLLFDYTDHALIPVPLEGTGVPDPRIPLGIELGEIALDPATDRLIVSDSAGRVHILDRHDYARIARLDGGRFLSLDLSHRRLYTGDAHLAMVKIYDLDSLSLLREIPQAGKPRANPFTGEVIVINRQAFVFDGATGAAHPPMLPDVGIPSASCLGCYYTIVREVIVDPARGLTATITYTPWAGKPGPEESVVVDPSSGRTWYALLTGGYIRQSSIAIYPDLGALQTQLRPTGDRSPVPPLRTLEGLTGILALDAPARRLYVGRFNTLLVLDSETLERLGRVKVEGWSPVIRAVDEELGRLYSTEESRLIVWTRESGAPAGWLPPQPFTPTQSFEWILPSPNFAQDQTVLVSVNQRLCRSTDGGKTWQNLLGELATAGWALRFTALFSPNYAQDRTIWVGMFVGDTLGEGVWVSTDGGNTWRDSSRGLLDLRVYRLVTSPNFAYDRTLLAYVYGRNGYVLYRSTDAGQTWQLVLRQAGYNQPPLPSPEELFFVEQPEPLFKCDYGGICQRSDDGGKTWQPFDTGNLSLDRLVNYAISPFFEGDRTVYFMTESALYRAALLNPQTTRWERCLSPQLRNRDPYTRTLSALAIAQSSESTYDLLIGTTAGEFYRLSPTKLSWESLAMPAIPTPSPRPTVTTTPAPTLSPTPCAVAPDERFGVTDDDLSGRFGCATAPAVATMVAYQPFENGRMFWRADLRRIYVLEYNGTWRAYEDTWNESQPISDPTIVTPELFFQPTRGFGKLWREQLGGSKAWIGWATAQEYGYETVIQAFTGGLLLRGENILYLLYNDDNWEAIELMP